MFTRGSVFRRCSRQGPATAINDVQVLNAWRRQAWLEQAIEKRTGPRCGKKHALPEQRVCRTFTGRHRRLEARGTQPSDNGNSHVKAMSKNKQICEEDCATCEHSEVVFLCFSKISGRFGVGFLQRSGDFRRCARRDSIAHKPQERLSFARKRKIE